MNNNDEHDAKHAILLAAVEEFGRKGYDATSTNTIIKKAGVSKGLLFHYYGSKNQLFLECVTYVLRSLNDYLLENMYFSDGDVFERIKTAIHMKTEFFEKNPNLIGMATWVWFAERLPGLSEHVKNIMKDYTPKTMKRFLEGIDISRFRKDMDFKIVMKYTWMLLELSWTRYVETQNGVVQNPENLRDYIKEVDAVLDLIKRGAYDESSS